MQTQINSLAGIDLSSVGNDGKSIEQRFWEKVKKTDSCWLWTAKKDHGYGRFYIARTSGIRAHRVAYMIEKGDIPIGLVLDHLCRERSCVNPSHLRAVTSRENILCGMGGAARKAAQTECINGHPFNEKNTSRHPRGWRQCRKCRHARETIRRRKKKALTKGGSK
jgi:hypothetical protein